MVGKPYQRHIHRSAGIGNLAQASESTTRLNSLANPPGTPPSLPMVTVTSSSSVWTSIWCLCCRWANVLQNYATCCIGKARSIYQRFKPCATGYRAGQIGVADF